MKVLVQRVLNAKVDISNKTNGEINQGLLLFVGFTKGDNLTNINYLVNKIIHLRIFDDENGVMNKSVLDINGEILSISQFTLYADTKKGYRPSYSHALNSNEAIKLYELFNQELSKYIKVETGVFGEEMQISLKNDGPVTIILEK